MSINLKDDCLYTETHEWLTVDGTKGRVGLTDYAQHHLGQVVFVDLPEPDSSVTAGQQMAEVESVKAVSEFYAPVDGTVLAVNEELFDNPGLINDDAYAAWFAEIEMTDLSGLDRLMDKVAYQVYVDGLTE